MRYPGATWRPLPEEKNPTPLHATQVVFHSAVTKASSLYAFFARPDVVVESHGYVEENGDTEQYIDYLHKADAQVKGNARAISWETWDNGNPEVTPWNDAQMARLVDIAVDAHRQLGIPLQRCKTWDGPGFGGHHDFPEWNPNKHSCPGRARYAQIDVILSKARSIVSQGQATAVHPPGPVVVHSQPPKAVPVKAPKFPLPAGSFFGPKELGKESVSGFYSHQLDLAKWQTQMKKRGWNIGTDGHYGKQTHDIAVAFQREKGLLADAKIGPATWAAAWTEPVH